MKKILFLALAMLCSLSNAFAQSWTSGQQVGNGSFYLYNLGAQRYLSQGTKWKTHAVVDGAGMEIGVSTSQNGVSLHTGLTSGSGPYVGIRDDGEVFMDFPQTEFVCEAVSVEGYTNAYKLKCTKESTTYYLGWRGGTGESGNEVLTTTTDPSNNKNFLWLLIKPSDRTLDVTNLITNPDFEYWTTDEYHRYDGFGGWTRTYGTANDDTYNKFIKHNSTTSFTSGIFAEAWIWSDQKLQAQKCWQNITIPTVGYYTLTVTGQAANQQEGKASTKGVKLYLKQNGNTNSIIIGAAGTHTVTMYANTGSLELGVEIEQGNDANWVAFDNVRLYYHSDAPATYNEDREHNTLTFTGAGWLDKKSFDMKDYTVIVGNPSVDAEKAKVQNNGGYGAYVTDRNGYDHAFYDSNTKLPLGYGTYFTIIPKTDGFLKLEVKAINGGNDTPLIFVDASGNVDEFIPYSEISSGFTSVDCGFVEEGKVYYLYSRTWATLLLHKTEFTTVPQHLASLPYGMSGSTAGWSLVEENDFDQYGEIYQSQHVWVKHNALDCTLGVGTGNESIHGPYAFYNTGNANDRAVYYPFENLESRKRYIIEFDAWVKPQDANNANSHDYSQIALYRNLPGENASVTDYLLSIQIPKGGGTWKFFVKGDNNADTEVLSTNNLSNETWYHFILDVDARTPDAYKVGIVVQDEENNIKAQTNGMVHFTGNGTAKGIYYLAGRYNNQAKFDNIAIFSNQGSLGSVSTPKIELTGVDGTKRTVTVTGGVADLNFDVTTYYSYITVENNYNTTWDAILNAESWKSWTTTDMADIAPSNQPSSIELPEFDPNSRTTYIIRAISTINDYATVLSDTAYLRVVAGEQWTLSGGFEVVSMTQEADGYYTPTLRAYVNTGILPDGTNVKSKVTYVPVDYGTHDPNNNTPYPDNYTPSSVVLNLDWSTPENSSVTYSEPFVAPRSADYTLNLSAEGFNPSTPTRRFYKDKYKVTYSTPDFASVTNPVNDFASFDANFVGASGVYGYSSWMRQVSTNNGNINIWQTVAPITVPGWATSTENDYTWNGTEKGKTATMNSIIPAKSAGSEQHYTFRTNQSNTENALILKVGYGLVKNTNSAWNYRCGLAHIGMGNEIPEFTYDTGNGNGHEIHYAYPNPYITGSNVPECNYSVPAYAALKQYKVYTPVETKKIPATSGLASFSSYYSLYHVDDFYMINDELVGSFYAPSHYKFGGSYYLNKTWYMKDRNGFLLAANIYNEKDIWQGYKEFVKYKEENPENPWNEDLTIELRIIDETPTNIWSDRVENELMPVLMDIDDYDNVDENLRVDHSSDRITITGSSNGNNNGWPNMILYKGKRNDDVCYNFFCLPSATSRAKMANKTSYLQRTGNTYADYINSQSSVKEEGERIFFGMVGNDDEAVGIDMVESNVNATGNDTFYNLAGQRVSTPTKGIYIHNGKKVLVK